MHGEHQKMYDEWQRQIQLHKPPKKEADAFLKDLKKIVEKHGIEIRHLWESVFLWKGSKEKPLTGEVFEELYKTYVKPRDY